VKTLDVNVRGICNSIDMGQHIHIVVHLVEEQVVMHDASQPEWEHRMTETHK